MHPEDWVAAQLGVATCRSAEEKVHTGPEIQCTAASHVAWLSATQHGQRLQGAGLRC